MRLVIDLDYLDLIADVTDRKRVLSINTKRGDSTPFEVVFVRAGVLQVLPEFTVLTFACKADGKYDADPVVFHNDFELSGEPDSPVYKGKPNFNTVELNALFLIDGDPDNDVPEVELMAEFSWSITGADPTSVRTFRVIVANDVIRNDEGIPEDAVPGYPAPDELLYTIPQTLTAPQKAQVIENLGLGTSATLDWTDGLDGEDDAYKLLRLQANGQACARYFQARGIVGEAGQLVALGISKLHAAVISASLITGTRTYQLPDASGTFALVGGALGAASATSLTVSGSVTAASIVIDAVISSSSRRVAVGSSRNLANSDNGKRLVVTGTSAVVLTAVSGLTSGFSCEIINNTTGAGSLVIAASGVTLKGGTDSILVDRSLTAAVVWTDSNAYQVSGHDLLRQIRINMGCLQGSDLVNRFSDYRRVKAMGYAAGLGTSLTADALVDGSFSYFGSTAAMSSNSLDIFRIQGPSANGRAYGIAILGAMTAMTDTWPLVAFGSRRVSAAARIRRFDAIGMTGRRVYVGVGKMSAGGASALTKGKMAVGIGGYSDYVQLWDGSAWSDTALKWKNGTTLLVDAYDVQIISDGSSTVLQARQSSDTDTATWTTLKTYSSTLDANGYGAGWEQFVVANIVDNSTFDPVSGNSTSVQIEALSIGFNA